MKIKNITAVLITSLSFMGLANAAKPGVYLGAGLGYSSLNNFSDTTQAKRSGLGGQVFIGYNVNTYVGIEASYRKYANNKYEISFYDYDFTIDYNISAVTLVGKSYLPITENSPFSFYLLVGIVEVFGNSDIKYGSHNIESLSENAFTGTIGLGASYDINANVTTHFEYSRTGGKNSDSKHLGIPASNLATLNIAYTFA